MGCGAVLSLPGDSFRNQLEDEMPNTVAAGQRKSDIKSEGLGDNICAVVGWNAAPSP